MGLFITESERGFEDSDDDSDNSEMNDDNHQRPIEQEYCSNTNTILEKNSVLSNDENNLFTFLGQSVAFNKNNCEPLPVHQQPQNPAYNTNNNFFINKPKDIKYWAHNTLSEATINHFNDGQALNLSKEHEKLRLKDNTPLSTQQPNKNYKESYKNKTKKCSFCSCTNNSIDNENINFFQFNDTNHSSWIEACQNDHLRTLKKATLFAEYFICELHFHRNDFTILVEPNEMRLNQFAVPRNYTGKHSSLVIVI